MDWWPDYNPADDLIDDHDLYRWLIDDMSHTGQDQDVVTGSGFHSIANPEPVT